MHNKIPQASLYLTMIFLLLVERSKRDQMKIPIIVKYPEIYGHSETAQPVFLLFNLHYSKSMWESSFCRAILHNRCAKNEPKNELKRMKADLKG